jgi:hypothetical protein
MANFSFFADMDDILADVARVYRQSKRVFSGNGGRVPSCGQGKSRVG